MKELYLIPVELETEDLSYGYTLLSLDFDLRLFEEIERLESVPVPDNFQSWLEVENNTLQQGLTQVDEYQNPLRTVKAGETANAFMLYANKSFPRNNAAWKYLTQLSP